MRRLMFAAAPLVFTTFAHAAEPAAEPIVHNMASAFVEFWDANKNHPTTEQLAAFKAQMASAIPGFYDIKRFQGNMTQEKYDALIAGAIKDFPIIREEYLHKARQFEGELPKHIATFKTRFPDFRPTHEIYVLHSLGEMDGGTRVIGNKEYLIFGVDGMVKYHGTGNESAFFHHELFHTYHQSMNDCDDGVWSNLWREGLATYVSKSMNPGANNQELLLAIPPQMAERTQAVLPAALEHLEKVLDNTDFPTSAGLFNSRPADQTGMPSRRGYYLGYLVAEEAARTRDLRELAKLGCGPVKELVYATVRALRAKHPTN